MDAETVGSLLREWRRQRGFSQLDLALEAHASQRHVSFVESGRSQPSRELLLRLAVALRVPLRDRNLLLLAAGYAPVYVESAWDAPEMRPVRQAVAQILERHEPHPALVLDRHWRVLETNRAAPQFFGQFLDLATFPRPRNLLHLMLDPAGLRPWVENWEAVAAGLLARFRNETVGQLWDRQSGALLEELLRYPGVAALPPLPRSALPVVPITFVRDDRRWSYWSLISTVGMPQDITAQEFRLECMFPAE